MNAWIQDPLEGLWNWFDEAEEGEMYWLTEDEAREFEAGFEESE